MLLGVPFEKILIERNSTNTGENLELSRKLLEERGIQLKRLVIVHIPFMARRAYGSVLQKWKGVDLEVTFKLPNLDFQEELKRGDKTEILEVMVGEVQRTKYQIRYYFIMCFTDFIRKDIIQS